MISRNFLVAIRNNKHWLKDGSLITFFIALNKIINLVLKYFLAKKGIDVLGETQFLLTNITFLSSLAFLGFPGALVRFISIFTENKEFERAKNLTSWLVKKVFIIGLIISFCFYVINKLVLKINNINFLFYLAIPLLAILEIIWQESNAKKEFLKFAAGKFITFPLLRLVTLLVLINFNNLSNEKIISYHIYFALIFCILIWTKEIAKSFFKQKKDLDIKLGENTKKEFLNYSFYLNIGFITLLIYENLDIYLLKLSSGETSIGIYSIYLTITNFIDLALNPFINILQTHLAKFHQNFKLGLKNLEQKTLILFLVSFIFSLFILLNRKLFFNFFNLDLTYQSTNLISLFLVDKIINIALILPISIFLDFYQHQKYTAKLGVYSLLTKIILCLLLYREINIINIVWINILSKLIQLNFLYFYTKRQKQIKTTLS